ncbi:MAG TPA: hypothetical protein VF720_04115 [Candidatus Eisenbacteria bacterium]
MKPGPGDRFLIRLLLGLNLAMLVALPVLAVTLWRELGGPAWRDAARFRPLVVLVAAGGEFLLIRRFRGILARLRGI